MYYKPTKNNDKSKRNLIISKNAINTACKQLKQILRVYSLACQLVFNKYYLSCLRFYFRLIFFRHRILR